LYIPYEFTNFAAIVLLFVNLCFATINVNTASNVEIASFMENESKKILQVPDTSTLTIDFQTAKDEHGRAWILFFVGERKISIKANYTLASPSKEIIKGSLKADTSWYTGYCGMIECQNEPMPVKQRIETLKYLVSKMLMELSGKVNLLFAVDSTTKKQDSIQEQQE